MQKWKAHIGEALQYEELQNTMARQMNASFSGLSARLIIFRMKKIQAKSINMQVLVIFAYLFMNPRNPGKDLLRNSGKQTCLRINT